MKLQGRVAVITGASSGVGYETARRLAREGAIVAAAARRHDKLEWLVGEIAGEGGRALAFPTDVTQPEQVERLIAATANLFGRIDILVNCAGSMLKVAPLEQWSDSEFADIIAANLYGSFYSARAVIPHMKRQGSGTIIMIGSRVGKIGIANIAPFCAAKFALAGLSQALAQELRPANIYVSTIVLGMTNTDILPLNPGAKLRTQLMRARDVAEAVLWTCTLPASMRMDELVLMPRTLDL